LMTIHGSKGLEFPVVFLPNLAKEMFPSRKPPTQVKLPPGLAPDAEGGEGSEDECLFFVALSRARDHLVLSRPRTVGGKPRDPSPLLALIADDLGSCGAQRVEWKARVQGSGFGVQEKPSSLNPEPRTLNPEFSLRVV